MHTLSLISSLEDVRYINEPIILLYRVSSTSLADSSLSNLQLGCMGYNMNNFNLVGKIFTVKEYNFGAIKAGLMGMWGIPTGVVITEAERNTFLISCNDHDKGRQILNRGPWSFRGHLVNLSLWTSLQHIDANNHNIMEI
ncbi:hypothetical protein PIB30_075278 [Stylosanthes scabra]|uniref:DUF4283 domain-containing protein n=1 Tax=Stylosanthes scabra TaxID=79078 RepID=A0ABU6XN95_9FABA|nr:hypothetical protein [Stylosanthes scabra]